MFIYLTTNIINGKRYVGLCTRDDPAYIGSGVLLKQAIKKYGRNNFRREILEESDDFDHLLEREAFWISHFDAVNSPDFYNISYGGRAGNSTLLKDYWKHMTTEERRRARNWKPHFAGGWYSGDIHASKVDPEWSAKASDRVTRMWANMSEEDRLTRAASTSRTRKRSGVSRGANNPMFGRSAITEQRLRWYTDGNTTIYVTEGSQPKGFTRGRTMRKRHEHKQQKGG